jgi:hypothetical protein
MALRSFSASTEMMGVAVSANGVLHLLPDAPPPPAGESESFERYGFLVSPVEETDSPTSRFAVSYDATVPEGSALRLDVRGSADGERWTAWETEVAPQGAGMVILPQVVQMVQYRVTLLGSGAAGPTLRAIEIAPLAGTAAYRAFDVNAGTTVVAPTYRIRATRLGMVGGRTANGHIIKPRDRFVALPSWRSLNVRGGTDYQVRITYRGRSVVAPVWDVGPWNTHDDYWSVHRERFQDLRRGWPQDHAAYFEGYNGGYAEKGFVRFPTAMDVGDGLWWELGIPGDQGEVEVTFLWLGADPLRVPTPTPTPQATATPSPTSTPQEAIPVVSVVYRRDDASGPGPVEAFPSPTQTPETSETSETTEVLTPTQEAAPSPAAVSVAPSPTQTPETPEATEVLTPTQEVAPSPAAVSVAPSPTRGPETPETPETPAPPETTEVLTRTSTPTLTPTHEVATVHQGGVSVQQSVQQQPSPASHPSMDSDSDDAGVVVTVDEQQGPAFIAEAGSLWYHTFSGCGRGDHALWSLTTVDPSLETSQARWQPDLPQDGSYEVRVHIPSCEGTYPTTSSAHYTVHTSDGPRQVVVDQTGAGGWVPIGKFPFASGTDGFVSLSNVAGDSGRAVWFDDVQWVLATGAEEPATRSHEPGNHEE